MIRYVVSQSTNCLCEEGSVYLVSGTIIDENQILSVSDHLIIFRSGTQRYTISKLFVGYENPDIQLRLTPVDIQLLQMAANGLKNKQIARERMVSVQTVKNQFSALFRKMGVADRTAAAVMAYRLEIIR